MALGCAPDLASQRPADESRLEVYSTLLQWMRAHGGDLDENVYISHDSQRGTHIRVKREGVPSNAHIIKTPIATTLSYFNAIDHRSGETNFPAHGINLPREFIDSVGPEEASIFFLVGQFLRGSESFWYPYLQSLPQPGSLTTLPYYEEDEDLEWLEGTSLIQARTQKIAQLRDKYETSSSELSKSKFRDAGKYSWDLYVWASTIFVSRAFSAKVLSGVVPDLGVPEENISVLLPFIDILNHRPLAKVEWRAGTESVDFVVLEEVGADQEIANNYGPRNNEQLMMNYGFCLSDNPCDYRTVGLRAPPGSPLQIARERQQELFPDSNKDTEGPYYVFNIFYPLLAPDIPMEHSIFSPALFNAVSILAANQRELETLEISGHEIRIPNAYGNSRAIVAALSQIIIERNSQVRLSESALVIAAWTLQRAQLHGLKGGWDETKRLLAEHMACLPKGKFSEAVESRIQVRILERPSVLAKTGELFAPHDLLHLLPVEVQKHFQECLSAVLKTTSRNMSALRGITQRAYPFQFPLFACFVVAVHIKYSHNPPGEGENFLPARLSRWASLILDHYQTPTDDVAWALEDEDDEALLSEFDEVVETMREHNATVFSNLEAFTGGWQGDAWWLSGNWVRWAWMVTEQEGVQTPEDPLALLSSNKSENITLSTAAYLYIPQE